MRRIIQISIDNGLLFGLCDDGTVWNYVQSDMTTPDVRRGWYPFDMTGIKPETAKTYEVNEDGLPGFCG